MAIQTRRQVAFVLVYSGIYKSQLKNRLLRSRGSHAMFNIIRDGWWRMVTWYVVGSIKWGWPRNGAVSNLCGLASNEGDQLSIEAAATISQQHETSGAMAGRTKGIGAPGASGWVATVAGWQQQRKQRQGKQQHQQQPLILKGTC